ncbi:lichenan operon transcriptional antiterminator [Enterococcus sp. AZ194]|uniref:BglG family transcription antiterminator n=1 Tax=Enterococcus sp. AZ194 TaxID=2774629 RepID=UPI003F28E239
MELKFDRLRQFFEENLRYKALFLILLRSDTDLTSEFLAEELDVTSRTIKSDFKNMKPALAELGIQLNSKRGMGYSLSYQTESLSNELKTYFQMYQPRKLDTETDLRVHYIMKRLLTTARPIELEDLADELFLSGTDALSRELKLAEKVFAFYQLSVVRHRQKGLMIEGTEFAKLLCAIRLCRYFNDPLPQIYQVPDFDEIFATNQETFSKIRNILLNTLIPLDLVFSDLYVERYMLLLLYFNNQLLKGQTIRVILPRIDFAFQETLEYQFVDELTHKLRNQLPGFEFADDIKEVLTSVAIMSIDLYRFKDCSHERYGVLIDLAEETRNYLLKFFSKELGVNFFDDFTVMKDLLKIMIPVSLKIRLGVSDDIDFGFHDYEEGMKKRPIAYFYTQLCAKEFARSYGYHLSVREEYLVFEIILGSINRIKLEPKKLKLAIIALDGRLATQQLKFNLQSHFSEYIDRIDTKVLSELEIMGQHDYDYYLCIEYGKNLGITYRPMYYADETLSETEYVASLKNIFMSAYDYELQLPFIQVERINNQLYLEDFPVNEYASSSLTEYHHIRVGQQELVSVYFSLNKETEKIHILRYENPDKVTLNGEQLVVVADLSIVDGKKLKMFMTLIDKIAEKPHLLLDDTKTLQETYAELLI